MKTSTTWNGKLAKCVTMFWYTQLYVLLGHVHLHFYQTCVIFFFFILTTAECRKKSRIYFVMDLHLPHEKMDLGFQQQSKCL